LEDNLKDLPKHCNVGTKKNSKGYKETWIGYKLHLDCIDGDIPISAILSSASLHDLLANAVDFVDLKCRFDVTAKTARVREACVGGENLGRPGFKQIQQGAIPK
jgi:hypothetical protein